MPGATRNFKGIDISHWLKLSIYTRAAGTPEWTDLYNNYVHPTIEQQLDKFSIEGMMNFGNVEFVQLQQWRQMVFCILLQWKKLTKTL